MRALSPEKSDNFCRRNSDVSQRCSSVEKTTFGMHKSSQIESCPATSLVELKTSGGIKWTENLVHKHNRTFFNGIEIRFPKVRLKRCNDSIQNFSSTLDSEVISINDISSFSPSSSDGEKAEKQLHEVSRKKQKKRFMQISAETSSRGSNRSISVDDFGSTSDDGHSTSAIGWNSLSGMQTQPTFLALKPIPTLDQQLIGEKRFDSFNAHNFDSCVKPHVCSVDQQGRRGFSKKVKLGKCRCKEIDFSSECKCLHVCSSCAFLQENEVEKESNELDGCTSHIRLNGQREFDLEENKDVIFRERPLPVVDNEELDSIDSDTPLIQVFEKLKKSSKKKKRKFRPHKESCAKKIRQPLDESERSPRFAPEKETKQKRHDDLENPKEEDSKTSEHLLADRPVSCTSLKFRHSQKGKRWLWDAFSYLSQSGIDKEDELVKPEHCALRNKQLVPASDLSNVDLESNSDSDTLPDVDFLLSTCRSDDRLNASDLSNVDRESDSDTLPDVDFLLSTCRSDDGLNASTVLHPEKNHQQVNEKNNTCTSETNKNYTPVNGQRQNMCDEQVQNSSRDIDWQRNSNLNLISLSDDTTSEAENEGSKGEKSHLRNQFLRTRMLNTQTRSLGKAKGWRNPEIMVEKKQKIATDSNVVCSKFGEPKTENGSNRKCVQNIGLMSGKSQKLDGLEQTCKLIKENELKINLDNLLKSSSLTSVDQGQSDLDKRGEPKEIGGLLTIKTEPRSQNDENESSKVADNLGKSGALKAEPETVTNFSAMSSHCCPGSAIKSEEPESEFSYSQEDEVILIYDSEDAETLKDLSLEQHSSEEKSNDKTYKAAYRGSSRNNKSFDDVLGKTESDLFGTLRTKARSLSSNELFEECYKMSDSQYKYREKEAKQKPMDVSFDSDDSDKSSSCGKTKFLSLSEKSMKPNLFESFSLSTAEFGDDNFRKKFKKSSKSHTVSSSGDASSVCAELLPKHMSPVLSDKDGEHIDACSTSTQVRSTQQNFREIRRFPETSVPVPYRCSTSGVSGFSGKLKCISKLEKWSPENDEDDILYQNETQVNREEADVDTSVSLLIEKNKVKHLSKAADLEEIDSDDDLYLDQTQVDTSFSLPVKENKVKHRSKVADLEEIDSDDDLYLDQTQVDTSFSLPVKENEVKHLSKAADLEEIDSDDDQYLVQTQVDASFSLPVKENKVQHLSKAADLDDDLYLDQTQVDTSFSLPVAKSKVQRLSKAADLEEVDSDDDLYSRLTQVDDRTKSDSLEFPNEISRIALTRKKHCFEISDYTSVTPTYVNTGVKPCESDREYSVDKDKVRSSFTKPPDFFKAETSKMEQKMLEEKYDLEGRLYYNAMKIDSKKNGRSIKKEDEDICPPVIQASKDFKQQLNLFSICENLPHCKSLSNRRKNNLSNKKIQCLHEIKAQNKFKKPELTFSTKDIKKLDNQDDDDVYCSTTQVDNNKAALSSDEDDLYNIATQMPIDGSMKKKSKAYDKKKKEINQQNYENKDDSLYLAATQVVDFDSDNKTSSLFQKNSNSEHFSFNEDSCSLSPCGSPEIEDGIYEGATLVDDADTTESAGKVSLPDHLSLKSASSERLESRDSETYQLMPARNATKLAVEIQPQRWKSRQEMRKSFILKKNLSLDEGQHDTVVNKPGCNLVSRQLSADSCKGLSKKKACSPKSPLDQKRKKRHWKKALPSVSLREKIVEAKHQLAERMFRKVVDPQFPKPVRKMTNLSSDSSNVPQYMTDVSLPDEAEIMKKGLPLLSADMLILKNRQSTEKQETYQNLFPESCRFTASGKMTEEENEQECKGKDAAKQIAATKDGGLPTLQEGNLLHCIDGNKRNEDRQLDKIAGSLNNLLVEQDYSSKFTKLTTTMLEFSDKHSESHQKPVDQPRAIQRKKLNNRSCNLGQNSLLQDKMNVPNYSNSLSYPGTSHGQSYSLVPVTTSNSSDATLPSNRYKPVSINMDSFFAEILKWHPKWLDEQEKVKHLPPVINHKQLLPLLEMYESFSDYHQIMKPLLLLETWESISKDWKRNRDSGKNHSYKLAFGNVQILPTITTTSLMNYVLHGILTKEQADTGRHLLEGDLVVIYLCGMAFPKKPEDRMCQSYPVMGYVEKVRINTVPNNMQHLMKFPVLSKTLVRNSDGFRTYTVTIKGCYRKIVPNTEKLMEIKLVASIVTQIRHYHALLALPSSKLMKHILQPGDPAVFLSFQKNRSAGTSQYNSSQMQAICSSSSLALKPLSQPAICLLQGPPGTGKSYTIIGIIKKLIKDSERKAKILLCAPSNAAVDELTRRLIVERHAVSRKDTKAALRIVRIGNTESIDEDVVNYSLSMLIKKNARIKKNSHLESMHKELQRIYTRKKYIQNQLNETGICLEDVWKLNKDLKGLIEKEKILKSTTASASKIYDAQTLTYKEEVTIRRSILLKADVICSTLNSMGSNMLLSDFNTHSLTCAIIDEAAQSIELDSLIPLQYGINKLILVGDTEQLPPTVLSRRTAELSYGLSLFERLCNYFRDNSPDHNPILMLDTQYRMAVQICQFPNRYIYNNKLITSNLCSMNEKSINFPLQPYLVFDVKQGQECSAGLGSISNPIEADFTVMLCKCIIQKAHLPPSSSIGIIAPYQKQKVLLRELLRQNNVHDIEISTLDGFQGREKDVIIMSCVRARSNNGGIGFLANRRRMNVSLTRAKFALYVVGHLDSLQTDEDWRSLVADAKARDLVVPIFHPATFCEAAQKCLKNSF